MSFLSDLFGAGGAGSSLISSAGNIGLGLVQNDGAKIQSDYQLALAKLAADAKTSDAQFNISLAKLNQNRQANLAAYADQKRNVGLLVLGVVGGVAMLITVAVMLTGQRKSAPPVPPVVKRRRNG